MAERRRPYNDRGYNQPPARPTSRARPKPNHPVPKPPGPGRLQPPPPPPPGPPPAKLTTAERRTRILELFRLYGVDPAFMGVGQGPDASRIDRLVGEIESGREWHNLEISIMRLAAQTATGSRRQILESFIQNGIPLTWYRDMSGNVTERPLERLTRLEAELAGGRTLDQLNASLDSQRGEFMLWYDRYGRNPNPVGEPPPGPPAPPGEEQPPGPPATPPGVEPPPPGTGPTDDPSGLQRDALARLREIFRSYDLPDSLADWAWQQLVAGRSENEILLDFYVPGNAAYDAFSARFPQIFRRQERGVDPISPADVLNYERTLNQEMSRMGIGNFFSRDLVARLMGDYDVSMRESQERLYEGFAEVAFHPETRTAFQSYYGVQGDQALAAFFLDPEQTLPELERMANAAMVGGLGMNFDVHLKRDRAMQVADLGYDRAQAQRGFMEVDEMSPLYDEALAERGKDFDFRAEMEGVDAVFGLGEGGRQKLQRRLRTRQAWTSGGGGALLTERGLVGVGSAD